MVSPPNDVVALNAATGRVLWTYHYVPASVGVCCGRVNRGLAILGHTLFVGTLDAHLLALNVDTGKLVWNTTVADAADPACQNGYCYAITHAPLVVKNKVIVGTAGSDAGPGKGMRGFIAAFDVTTGKEVWRFNAVPGPGEPGNDSWSGESWKFGGAGIWNTGSYDPDLNLTYWGTGNPNPTSDPNSRLGDNLYSDSVVALDADTGKLKWFYQFNPHDVMDYDAAQIPVLVDHPWQGQMRRLMLWANKNGIMYVLDRSTGEFLSGKPFSEVTWMDGFDQKGQPKIRVGVEPGNILPFVGATNWYPPSYSTSTKLFYIPSRDRRSTRGSASGSIKSFDFATGEQKWEFKRNDAVFSGILTTASDLLFSGVWGDTNGGSDAARLADGYFYALDGRTGQLLWQFSLAGGIWSGPMSFSVNGKQYIAVAAGDALFAFATRQ